MFGIEDMTVFLAVFAIFNAKRRLVQTEREHGVRDCMRAQRDSRNPLKDSL